ncbi:hypothetical protein [Peribacillus muralis]|uniref:hypothetical protein n=1 Tax=Peribacillus muralis TaxID=264697 RepID=UPI00070AA9E2|nr:hypothetical protein [Peribacillus muralis]
MNNGPGKRGSFNVKKIKNPIVRVLKKEEGSPEDFLLGFIFTGMHYIIPQIIINFDGDKISTNYMSNTLSEKSVDDFPQNLTKMLMHFFKSKKRFYKQVIMPFFYMPYRNNKHFVNIGYYQGKWYVATSHKQLNMDFVALTVLPMLNKPLQESNKLNKPELLDNVILKYKDRIDTDASKFYFLYLKTAFNALTLFKGTDFISNEFFDEIRESIIELKDVKKFVLPNDKVMYETEIGEYAKNIPDKAHYVIISSRDNMLIAYVSFYGEIPGRFKLTDKYQGEDFIDGLICDWKNRKELRFEDLQV